MKIDERIDIYLNEETQVALTNKIKNKEKLSKKELIAYKTYFESVISIEKIFNKMIDHAEKKKILTNYDLDVLKNARYIFKNVIPLNDVKN